MTFQNSIENLGASAPPAPMGPQPKVGQVGNLRRIGNPPPRVGTLAAEQGSLLL